MENKIIHFGGIEIQAPENWEDITDSIGDGGVFTIADPEDGLGALQFSIAIYRRGKLPQMSPEQLKRMVRAFGEERGWAEGKESVHFRDENIMIEGITYEADEEIYRVWYVSDGLSLALVTYSCEKTDRGEELEVAEIAIRSIRFVE